MLNLVNLSYEVFAIFSFEFKLINIVASLETVLDVLNLLDVYVLKVNFVGAFHLTDVNDCPIVHHLMQMLKELFEMSIEGSDDTGVEATLMKQTNTLAFALLPDF